MKWTITDKVGLDQRRIRFLLAGHHHCPLAIEFKPIRKGSKTAYSGGCSVFGFIIRVRITTDPDRYPVAYVRRYPEYDQTYVDKQDLAERVFLHELCHHDQWFDSHNTDVYRHRGEPSPEHRGIASLYIDTKLGHLAEREYLLESETPQIIQDLLQIYSVGWSIPRRLGAKWNPPCPGTCE